MRKLFLLLILGVFSLAAKPYGKLIKTHSYRSCHYYDVVIYDDNGTKNNKDDFAIAKGVIRDCKNEACLSYDKVEILEVKNLSWGQDCKVYDLRIHFKKGFSLRGAAISMACSE